MAGQSSQGSIIRIRDHLAAPVTGEITALTRAEPCMMTFDPAAPMPAPGNIVVPRDTGWKSLDGRPFMAIAANFNDSIYLGDADTTGEGAEPRAGASFDIPAWLELCRASFTLNAPAGGLVGATTLCDDEQLVVPGMRGLGTWTANGFYDAADMALRAARNTYRRGTFTLLDVRFRDGSGATFAATVSTLDVSLAVNAAVTNMLGGTVDRGVCFYDGSQPDIFGLAFSAAAFAAGTFAIEGPP